MLQRIEPLTGDTGSTRKKPSGSGLLLGNIPMIFSHAEYARALLQLANTWPRDL
jgi:GH15 family glucan-1,4-alpha-glucosidase